MVKRHFDYEEKYKNLREKFQELKKLSQSMDFDLTQEFQQLEEKMEDIRGTKYHNLSPWEKVLLSRHPKRPVVKDYIEYLFEDWIELHCVLRRGIIWHFPIFERSRILFQYAKISVFFEQPS
jgi:acetyl-CoA carboxylase carboxyl transferase subunit alpha